MAKVYHTDLWGLRHGKYQTLSETDIASTSWNELEPNKPFYFFVPRHEEVRSEYEQGLKVNDIFPTNSVGAMSGHDGFVVSHTLRELQEKMDFIRGAASDAEVTVKYGLADHQNWQLSQARLLLKQDKGWKRHFRQYDYRPFDYRITFYADYMFARSLRHYLCHMIYDNMALLTQRQTYGRPFRHFFVTKGISDLNLTSNLGGTSVFPLYLYPTEGEVQFGEGHRRPNLNLEFVKAVSEKLGLTFVEDGNGDLEETFGPEDIFNYAYAIFHSPTYRTRYAEFLRIDFPRLPLTSDEGLFKALAAKGAALVSLHLMESPALNSLITRYPVACSSEVEKVSYDEDNQRVRINKTQYFDGVPPQVWNFHIGGYQVCQKWLKDRKGRKLSYDELTHYQKVIVALKETIRLMAEIDEVIEEHGGWPLDSAW
jgi:hypothetical protein